MRGKYWWQSGNCERDVRAAGTPVVRAAPEPARLAGPGTPEDGRADEIAEFLTRFYTYQQC